MHREFQLHWVMLSTIALVDSNFQAHLQLHFFHAAEWGFSAQYWMIFLFDTPFWAVQVPRHPPYPIQEQLLPQAAPRCQWQDVALAGGVILLFESVSWGLLLTCQALERDRALEKDWALMQVWMKFIFLVVPDPFPHFQPPQLALFFVGLKVYFTKFHIL